MVLQLDIGIADSVVPDPAWVDYPTLLAMEAPRILAYQPATAVAEKLQTMIEKGLINSRVKDYYDIWMLPRVMRFDGDELCSAIRATFDRRNTPVPVMTPDILTDEYAGQRNTRAQWDVFVRNMGVSGIEVPENFLSVVQEIESFLTPVLAASAAKQRLNLSWEPGCGWILPHAR